MSGAQGYQPCCLLRVNGSQGLVEYGMGPREADVTTFLT